MTKEPDKTTPRPGAPAQNQAQPQPPSDQRQDQPLRQIGATQEAASEEANDD